ncbi:MAG: hypothetical protein JO061_17120 [Acidobacteriaceae bacterium]|nr:hypothetical protein [Acidobacteriaceae bacterium]
MSETAQGTQGSAGNAHIDSICDFVRETLESMSDVITPPEQACQHFRESRLEFLRGVRAIVDHRIDRLSRKNQSGERVNVE